MGVHRKMKNSNILLKKRIKVQVSPFFSNEFSYLSGEYSKEIKPYGKLSSPYYATWPAGKLILLKDRLVIKILWKKWELPFAEINYIQKNHAKLVRLMMGSNHRIPVVLRKGMIINHKSKEVPQFVYIRGFRGFTLFELLKKINLENKLGLKFIE